MKYYYFPVFVLLLSLMLIGFSQKSLASNRSNYSAATCRDEYNIAGTDTLRHLPAFSYPDTSGKRFSLKDLKGNRRTLVVFWASWCAPCRKEIPALKELYNQYQKRGFSIISISVDQNINAWKKAVKEEKMPWTNVANLPDDQNSIMDHFGIKAVPSLFLLDDAGSILLADPTLEDLRAALKM